MIGRLKDKMGTSVIPPQINPFFAKVKKLKAVLILNRVYSGIDVKKAARKLLILSVVRTERLELSHLAAPEPKSGASTNFATSALI